MVTFTFGDRKAKLFLGYDPFDKSARLRYHSCLRNVVSGERALEILAEAWGCNQEEIQHDLPREVTTPEQELDFAMFYNGHPMAIRRSNPILDRELGPKLVWCGWNFRFDPQKDGFHEPVWRDVITKVEFETRPEYWERTVNRIMSDELGVVGWERFGKMDGKSYVKMRLSGSYLTPFRAVEGETLNGVFHVRRFTGDVVKVSIPLPQVAESVLKIVDEEKTKAIKNMIPNFFPTNTDVAVIRDYPDSILFGVNPIPCAESKYEIVWTSDNGRTAYLVRIPKSGQIRCPEEYKGQLIGKAGTKIKQLADRHGHRRLNVI